MALCGGTGSVLPADDNVREIFSQVAGAFAAAAGLAATDASADGVDSYKSQVVAGMNYFIKVKAAGKFYALRVFRGLDGSVSLASQKEIAADEEIAYF